MARFGPPVAFWTVTAMPSLAGPCGASADGVAAPVGEAVGEAPAAARPLPSSGVSVSSIFQMSPVSGSCMTTRFVSFGSSSVGTVSVVVRSAGIDLSSSPRS